MGCGRKGSKLKFWFSPGLQDLGCITKFKVKDKGLPGQSSIQE